MSAKEDPTTRLAQQLIDLLETQRGRGPQFYPLSVRSLVALAPREASAAQVGQAIAKRTFQRQVVLARGKHPEAPIALASDLELLAGSRLLLEFMLRSLRTASNQAFSAAQLKRKTSRKLQAAFQAAVNRQITEGSLPPTVGWLMINRTRKLFLLADLHVRAPESGVMVLRPSMQPSIRGEGAWAAELPASSFAQTFDQAFAELDRRSGGHNFVSLVDLRAALPMSRELFDHELQTLRRAGRYSLSSAEGRHGLSPEEAAAAITEDGTLLLYVSRKMP